MQEELAASNITFVEKVIGFVVYSVFKTSSRKPNRKWHEARQASRIVEVARLASRPGQICATRPMMCPQSVVTNGISTSA